MQTISLRKKTIMAVDGWYLHISGMESQQKGSNTPVAEGQQ